jgi:hypothetical protein
MKTQHSKLLVLAGSVLAGLLSLSTGVSAQSYESVTFRNQSLWNIHRIYVSPVTTGTWGDDTKVLTE